MPNLLEQEAFSIDEICQTSKLGRSTIYEEIREGRLVARKCGRRTIILKADRQAWLENLPRTGTEAV